MPRRTIYNSSGITLTNGDQAQLQADASGNLKVVTAASAANEYTEDAAAAANPIGPMMMAVRRDTLTTAEVSADGDNVAAKATSKGEIHTANLRLEALLPAALGSAAAAASLAVTQSTEDVARAGIITETAPATDTASSGLNGRLQRIAQRVTSLIALVPASLGRKSAALSLATVEAGSTYETVAASQTDQVLGGAGAAGDFLKRIIIQPVTTGAGTCLVKDGASTIFTFTTGTLADLSPLVVDFEIVSIGALSITTGANVTITAIGVFT